MELKTELTEEDEKRLVETATKMYKKDSRFRRIVDLSVEMSLPTEVDGLANTKAACQYSAGIAMVMFGIVLDQEMINGTDGSSERGDSSP